MQEKLDRLENEIENLKARNRQVELNKAWETSGWRRTLVAIFTYLPISLYMYAVGIRNPFLNAIVPTLGFLLSTLTLPFFKTIWQKRRDGSN